MKITNGQTVNMAGWAGFTDDDIRKMRQSAQTDDTSHTLNSAKKAGPQRQQQRGKPVRPPFSNANQDPVHPRERSTDWTDPSMKLTPHSDQKGRHSGQGGAVTSAHKVRQERDGSQLQAREVKPSANVEDENNKPDNGKTDKDKNGSGGAHIQLEGRDVKELDEQEALSLELDNVQRFQQRQKVIEEANKHKRALLAKAIEDRRKKAKAEAEKLMKVQQELSHLDTLLTADVSIIRDRIEVASLEYMDAQKRYEKAEKEFIAAKMDLFAKGEAKEHLTEHLYTIIHQNEVRKAKKLVELMEKLAMEVTPEEMELTIPAIPQLTNFTAVSTLHDPYRTKGTPSIDQDKGNATNINAADSQAADEAKLNKTSVDASGENPSASDGNTKELPCSSSIEKEKNSQTKMEATADVVTDRTNIASEIHPSQNPTSFDSSVKQLQNGTQLPNESAPGSSKLEDPVADLDKQKNPNPDLSEQSEALFKTSIDVTTSNIDGLTPLSDGRSETETKDSVNLSQEKVQLPVTLSSKVDTIPRSDAKIISENNDVSGKVLVSVNASSGKGWTLPFS